jgi:hypothetical protein
MSNALCRLLTAAPFRLPNDPGPTTVYTCADPNNNTSLTRTEQGTADAAFICQKHYYQSMQNIERACFTTLDSSIDDAFKIFNDPAIVVWHAGRNVREILDQLSLIYGQLTPATLELNDVAFQSQYLAADAPELLFRHIENCAKIAIFGQNPYTDWQLIDNAIRLLLTTGLYQRPFEEWDHLQPAAQSWIKLRRLIQDLFSVA